MGISKHLKYLKYIIAHKVYVGIECIRYRLPIAAITHDWQKLLPTEWSPYAQTFYGPYPYDQRPRDLVDSFDRAWAHHIHLGPHHWQYFVLIEDGGKQKVLEMPIRYRKEMIADWIGAGRALGKYQKGDRLAEVRGWYLANKDNMQLGASTRLWVEEELGITGENDG